jgi:type I restriction enzyme S subunit
MNAERLLEHFARIEDAPDAIPRLRRLILDLAVRGKLVPQDPNDEPASELLKRIAAEKARLVKMGEIRKQDALSPLQKAETPFLLPNNWTWIRVGEGFDYDAGSKQEPKELKPDLWLLELEDILKDSSVVLTRLRVQDRDSLSTKSEFEVGDILYGKLRPYLNKVVVADAPGYSTTEIVAIRPFLPICSAYCALAFRRPDFVKYVERLGQGTKMPRLRTADAIVAAFPLPPIAEQHRIVAKVDELMALCDRLEVARTEREATRGRLATASLARLNAPDRDPSTFADHARFALKNLTALTTRPDQVKGLRQTILNLAVRGNLVRQDPKDEPAGELLAKKTNLPEGHQRRRKILKKTSIEAPEDLLPVIPASWKYVDIQTLYDLNIVIDYADGNHGSLYPRSSEFSDSGVTFVTAKDLANGRVIWDFCGKLNPERANQLSKGWAQGGDILLTHNATVGRVARVEPEIGRFLLGTSVTFYRLNSKFIDPGFFFWVLRSSLWQGQLEAIMEQTTRNQVSIQKQAFFQIVVPPILEQHRIVAKVDELMALCDQLEASLAGGDATRRRLLDALLAEALAPGENAMPVEAARVAARG